jgi:hypothetical protein
MTKEDELDAKIANLFELDTPKDKPLISDEQQIAEFERAESARLLEEACQIFLTREREFQKIAEHPRVVTDIQMNCLWWDRLELMYQAEQAVWRIFCGGQPSPEQNKLYAKFRKLLLEGRKLKADA